MSWTLSGLVAMMERSRIPRKMTGIDLIALERQRQIVKEGWSPSHDDKHYNFELADAAICYANFGSGGPYSNKTTPPKLWPWDESWWKPSEDPIRNLEKAGALIAAEIDRLLRAKG